MKPTPAYLITYSTPDEGTVHRIFTHDKLLTARKAAISYVEVLLAQIWQRNDNQTSLTVQLVESPAESVSANSRLIARVFHLELPKQTLPHGTARSSYHTSLTQLQEEFNYYLAGAYSMGFGYFQVEVQEGESRETYCHLYDACGYVNELACEYETYRARNTVFLPVSSAYTHHDQHYRAGQLLDELIH